MLFECVNGLQHLVWCGTDPVAFGQIDPADRAGGIEQEFGWAGNGWITGALRMQQIVAPDNLSLSVRQQRKCIALLAGVIARNFRRVNADGHGPDATGRKLIQVMLDTPQLGVAGGSPIAAIKNEQDPFGEGAVLRSGEQIGE